MDWPKAKNILIVALLATNLFLLWSIFFSHRSDVADVDLKEQTAAVLQENGISLYCEIPTGPEKIAVLSVFYDDNTGIFEYDPPEGPSTPALSEETAQQAASEFLQEKGLMTDTTLFSSVTVSSFAENAYDVRYENRIEDIEIEGSYMVCTVTSQGIIRMERHWLLPDQYGKNKGTLSSASAALLSFLASLPEGTQKSVTDISLVYKLDSPYSEISETFADTAFPAWRITTSDGDTFYASALER